MDALKDLLTEAQKLDENLRKAHEELAQEQFRVSKNGLVSFTFYGDRSIKEVEITKEGLHPNNKELLEETIKIALREVLQNIKKAEEDINAKIMNVASLKARF